MSQRGREMSTCLVCSRDHRGTFACSECLADLRGRLRDLPGLAEELETQAAGLGRRGTAGAAARVGVRPLPFNEDAARVADEVRSVLVGWCRDICATSGDWPADTVPAMAARLAEHWWANDPRVDEFADEVAWAITQARSAIDTPAPRAYLGPCNLGRDGCRREVWARPAAAAVTCPACGSVIDVAARQLALLDACADTLAHAELIGQALTTLATPVKAATIRQWAHRGRLLAKGRDQLGRPLYLVSECRALAAQALVRRGGSVSA